MMLLMTARCHHYRPEFSLSLLNLSHFSRQLLRLTTRLRSDFAFVSPVCFAQNAVTGSENLEGEEAGIPACADDDGQDGVARHHAWQMGNSAGTGDDDQ
ncbi:hypothetical protein BH11VER1_BH11VER1_36520 [soil metagenome]